MAEYIEREVAVKAANEWVSEACVAPVMRVSRLFDKLQKVPAADVAPVVHGRWVTHYRSGTSVAKGYVSTCCDMWNNRKSNYCPNCGAKMDGGADHEDD